MDRVFAIIALLLAPSISPAAEVVELNDSTLGGTPRQAGRNSTAPSRTRAPTHL